MEVHLHQLTHVSGALEYFNHYNNNLKELKALFVLSFCYQCCCA
jgi:hypothetical protein